MAEQSVDIAVVLSGGGSKGAFQVGVLDELVTRRGLRVDLYAGISTGAIQALGAAQDQIPKLRAVWEAITGNGDVYKKRFLGLVGAVIVGADSQYNAGPIRKRIRAFFDFPALAASGKRLFVGAVSLRSGELVFRDETDRFVGEWVIASSAVPGTYEPLKTADGDKWVDGGVRDITPLSVVMRARPKAIIIVLASPRNDTAGRSSDSYGNVVDIAIRAAGILANEVFRNDIENADLINGILAALAAQRQRLDASELPQPDRDAILKPLTDIVAHYQLVPILVIEPDAAFDLPKSTEFDPAHLRRTIAHGKAVAARRWPEIKAFVEAL